MLPNFLIVGAMKAGTTWLAEMLSRHPDVFLATDEIHFFNDEERFARGLDWYARHFEGADGQRAVGEKTPGYLLAPEVPPRIAATLPTARILVALRNPVSRAISQINHHVRYGTLPLPPADGWIGTTEFATADKTYGILDRGRYRTQLERYFDTFGRERVFVVLNEADIRSNPATTLTRVANFLELSTAAAPQPARPVHQNRNSRLGVQLASQLPRFSGTILRVDRNLPGRKTTPYVPSDRDRNLLVEAYRAEEEALAALLRRPEILGWCR